MVLVSFRNFVRLVNLLSLKEPPSKMKCFLYCPKLLVSLTNAMFDIIKILCLWFTFHTTSDVKASFFLFPVYRQQSMFL